MPTQKFNTAILLAAIEGFEQQKLRIDAQIAELRAMLPGGPVVTPEAPIAKRRPMSAAARKRMSEAQTKRWAAALDGAGHTRTLEAEAQAECRRKSRDRCCAEETLGGEESGSSEGGAGRGKESRSEEGPYKEGREQGFNGQEVGIGSGKARR